MMDTGFSSPWISMDMDIWSRFYDAKYLVRVPNRAHLLLQDEISEHVYIVKTGRVLLTIISSSGVERILMFALSGCMIGEQALFHQTPQYYTARTVVACELYKIPISTLKSQLLTNPQLAYHILHMQSKKEKALTTSIVDLYFDDAYHRAVRELLYSAYIHGEQTSRGMLIKIPISQEQLGKRIQASRITVGKIHKRLTDENLIGREGQFYLLRNIKAMEEIISHNS